MVCGSAHSKDASRLCQHNTLMIPSRTVALKLCSRLVSRWNSWMMMMMMMRDDLHWLVIPQRVQYNLLWQSIVLFGTELHGTSSTTVCPSPKFLVASICDLPDVIDCQFREFAIALGTRAFSVAGPTVWNSLPDHLQDPAVDSEQFRRDLKAYRFAIHLKF